MARGKQFEIWFANKLRSKKDRLYYRRFIDSYILMQSKKRIVVSSPSDFIIVYMGTPIFTELKSMSKDKLTCQSIRDVQIEASKWIVSSGGIYVFLVWIKPTDYIYTLRAVDVLDYMEKHGRTSAIKGDELDEMSLYTCKKKDFKAEDMCTVISMIDSKEVLI